MIILHINPLAFESSYKDDDVYFVKTLLRYLYRKYMFFLN
ncbi:MAG: hypothetical protein RLZZ312_153 [Bacteroidota bacterium]